MRSNVFSWQTGASDPPRLDPGQRIVFAGLWVAIVAMLPNHLWPWQSLNCIPLLWLTWRGTKTPVPKSAHRQMGSRHRRWLSPRMRLWLLSLSLLSVGFVGQPGWSLRLLNFFIKAGISLWIMSLLLRLTPLPEFIEGLRQIGFPQFGTELLSFLARYLTVLEDEWRRMQLARRARTFQRRTPAEFLFLAQSLGWLFLRAYARAEQVHAAMLARGYRWR